MLFKILVGIFGSIALFLYGMQIMSRGLQKLTGTKLRELLKKLTANRFSELVTGFLLGSVMQSSGSAMAMIIGFVNANLLALKQSVAIILGAGIGGTIVVQLIAFRITQYALLFIGLGFFFGYIGKFKSARNFGNILLGFGCILLSLQLFGELAVPLEKGEGIKSLLLTIAKEPVLGIIISAFFTALFNSSSIMLGIIIAISSHNILGLESAIPLMLGANLGTCVTSVMASVGTSPEAKRVALLHVTFKIIGILLYFPFLHQFSDFVINTHPELSRQIANAHTLFNISLSIIFLPFTAIFANLATKLIPAPADEEIGFKVRYLDYRIIDNPLLALGHIQKEIRRLADRIQEMFDKVINIILKNDEEVADQIDKKEYEADTLAKAIITYLSELGQHPLSHEESRKAASLLYIVNDLEHIGDIISRLGKMGRKKVEYSLVFSQEGLSELINMHHSVKNNLDMAVIASLTGASINPPLPGISSRQALTSADTKGVPFCENLHLFVNCSVAAPMPSKVLRQTNLPLNETIILEDFNVVPPVLTVGFRFVHAIPFQYLIKSAGLPFTAYRI